MTGSVTGHVDCWLGVDIGTSACKVVAVDGDLTVVASKSADYPLYSPRPAWAEQDPAEWWDAVVTATRELTATLEGSHVVRAIGLCGQMHGLVALDRSGEVIRRAILWNDQRNSAEADQLVEDLGGSEALLELTNNNMLPCHTAGKLVWLRNHEPDAFERMRSWVNPKDYLRFKMTGGLVTDVSDASGTGMLDVRRRRWSTEVVDAVGLSGSAVPDLVESSDVTGALSADAAELLGLPAGIPVVGGGGDSVLQTTSMGVVDPGPMGVTIGTAGIVAAAADHCPVNPDGRLQVSCGNASDRWHVMGVALNAGGAWEWWRTSLAPLFGGTKPSHETLVDLTQRSVPGARGVRFLPYLHGERCPHTDPQARAGWMGVEASHDIADMTRAVLEGSLFNLREIRDLFDTAGLPTSDLRVSGGGSAHDAWLGPLADILGVPAQTVVGGEHGGAFGAALLAGIGDGAWDGLDTVVSAIGTATTRKPEDDAVRAYDAAYETFRSLYPALQDWYRAATVEQS
jgi:xylulokinase